jgi:hypothetical protein
MTEQELITYLTGPDVGLAAAAAGATAKRILAEQDAASKKLAADQAEAIKLQTELKAANDKLNVEMTEWASLTAAEQKRAKDQQASLEAAVTRSAQLEARLTALAQEHGVDPKPLIEGTVTIPKKEEPPPAPPIDVSKLVSTDVFGNVSAYNMTLATAVPYIIEQHRLLTGESLDPRFLNAEIQQRAGKQGAELDPIKIWEEKFGIPEKRAAKARAEHEAEIKAAEARGEDRARSEMAVPGAQAPGRHSIVFGQRDATGNVAARTSLLKRPQPESTVRAAAQALATHKYRSKTA